MASKTGGLKVTNDNGPEIEVPHEAASSGFFFAVADPPSEGGEGRCRAGRNGQMHRSGCRGTGPGIQGKVRRDNVGKGPFPAGTGDNLQRPADRGTTEVGGRDWVWRMSQYELRRMGNAVRGDARHLHRGGNADAVQRGSGHVAVPGWVQTLSWETCTPRSRNEPIGKAVEGGAYMRQHLSLPSTVKADRGKPRSEPDSGNPTVRDRRGARGNVTHAEL